MTLQYIRIGYRKYKIMKIYLFSEIETSKASKIFNEIREMLIKHKARKNVTYKVRDFLFELETDNIATFGNKIKEIFYNNNVRIKDITLEKSVK